MQVTYPYIMAKTRLQAGGGDDDDDDEDRVVEAAEGHLKPKKKERYDGAIDCLKQVYKEEGIVGWYQVRRRFLLLSLLPLPRGVETDREHWTGQGMQAQISKAVLAQALLFGIKDALEACSFFFPFCLPLYMLTLLPCRHYPLPRRLLPSPW
jgi:adenine nucleotide transporter 17